MTQKLIEDITTNSLKNLIGFYSASKIFLVTGKNSYKTSGAKDFIEDSISGYDSVRFSDFDQNPKYEDALHGTAFFNKSNCDLIVAIGGGSVIDMAKLINVFATNPKVNSLEIVKNSRLIANKPIPLIAIPTTAGTGSEATHFAVVYNDRKKYSVAHESILPDVAGLNSVFTVTQPKYLTACAGLDAFSQAIESYWSVSATSESKTYATKAIELLRLNLSKAVNNPCKESREAVMKGAYWAGRAINISKTTAAHAVSYAFTTFFNIPHGHAVFLTLPYFFILNSEISDLNVNDSRGANYVRSTMKDLCHLLGVNSSKEAFVFLNSYAKMIGIETSLDKLGINKKSDIERIIKNVNFERLRNNPVMIGSRELFRLWQ